MSRLRLLVRQVGYTNRAFWRNPESAFFTFVFPLVFMVIIDLVFASASTFGRPNEVISFYTPAIIAFSIINACFTTLAMTVAIARDEGLLKRVHGTPLPTSVYLAARVVHAVLMGFLLAAIVGTFGALVFGVTLPAGDLPALLLVLAIGTAAFAALGLAVAGLVPSSASAPAVVNAIVLPLLFISNVFIRVEDGPLVTISKIFPVRHFTDALQAVYHPALTGALDPADLLWVAAWGILGLVVARRTFTWEPRA